MFVQGVAKRERRVEVGLLLQRGVAAGGRHGDRGVAAGGRHGDRDLRTKGL